MHYKFSTRTVHGGASCRKKQKLGSKLTVETIVTTDDALNNISVYIINKVHHRIEFHVFLIHEIQPGKKFSLLPVVCLKLYFRDFLFHFLVYMQRQYVIRF